MTDVLSTGRPEDPPGGMGGDAPENGEAIAEMAATVSYPD
jgi:hypothetical protein